MKCAVKGPHLWQKRSCNRQWFSRNSNSVTCLQQTTLLNSIDRKALRRWNIEESPHECRCWKGNEQTVFRRYRYRWNTVGRSAVSTGTCSCFYVLHDMHKICCCTRDISTCRYFVFCAGDLFLRACQVKTRHHGMIQARYMMSGVFYRYFVRLWVGWTARLQLFVGWVETRQTDPKTQSSAN